MIENVKTFGKDECLVGIVTTPDDDIRGNNKPALIILNAGILHRVGPYRLSVDLARKCASMGFTVLRFDLSGIGDSATRQDSNSYKKRAENDIKEAIDFISTTTKNDKFILLGLCSGADNAHPVALNDNRVVGVIFLDACGYRTWKYYALHFSRRMFGPMRWKRFIMRKFKKILGEKSYRSPERSKEEKIFPRHFPPKEKTRSDVIQMMERGVKLLYIYTGGVQGYYNYIRQFEDMLSIKLKKYKDKLQVRYINNTDHIYTLIEDRYVLMETISDWIQFHYNNSNLNT